MAGSSNNRRFERFRGRVPCSYRDGEDGGRGFVTDLSAGGLRLETQKRFAADTKLVLELDLGEASPLVLTGSVARALKSHRATESVVRRGIGVRLDSAPESYFALILDMSRDDPDS